LPRVRRAAWKGLGRLLSAVAVPFLRRMEL
jgi:hypothetical protein